MAELITLEGTAQEKGKKVTGYKFPDNLDDLKFPFKMLFQPNYAISLTESITSVKNVDVPSRQVIFVKREKTSRGDKLLTKEGYSLGVSKGSFNKGNVVISPEKINADSITNTTKNVTKESINTSLKRYKILKTNKFSEPPFKVGDIVEGTLDSNGFLIVTRDFEGNKDVQFQFGKRDFQEVNQKKSSSNNSLEQDLNNSPLGKTARKIQIGFSVVGWGVFGILAYKFWNKSTTWKVILSVFGAYNLYSTYKVFSKPALQVEGGSDTGTSTSKETSSSSSSSNSITTANVTDYSNLNKYQKIDLIIKNQSGGEPMDADEFNSTKSFLNTLTDAELSIWIPLSKALKDSEVSQAGESGDEQKLYSLLQSKYGLTQQQVDEQMKKFGEFLMGSVQTAMGNSQFTGKNGMFSNFESSLDLDI